MIVIEVLVLKICRGVHERGGEHPCVFKRCFSKRLPASEWASSQEAVSGRIWMTRLENPCAIPQCHGCVG